MESNASVNPMLDQAGKTGRLEQQSSELIAQGYNEVLYVEVNCTCGEWRLGLSPTESLFEALVHSLRPQRSRRPLIRLCNGRT